MKNKNMVLFFVLSMIMLGAYYLMSARMYPPAPPTQAAQQPASQAAAASAAPTVAPAPTFTKAFGELELTWRTNDGALVQAVWTKDGTRFFNEETRDKKGQIVSRPFPGIGGTFDARFAGEPAVASEAGAATVTFTSPAGEKLVYRIPSQGHVVSVEWLSGSRTPLALVRMPADEKQIHGLKRVFTLDERKINAVDWSKMLSDPWFGKRKELPPAASRLGLDAGIDPAQSVQRSHYFCAIWEMASPVAREAGKGYSAAGEKVAGRLYLGPKQADQLTAFGAPYPQVLDFGFFGLVAKGMFWILQSLHKYIPNWGWTIVVFSVLLRLALWPLNTKTTLQMLRMKDLEPHQKVIQEKYAKFGNDMTKKAEMQKELMAFYKKNGHNPMGGCLPMLLQMPVFFALWSMLNAVFELRHSPFMGWIHDLSGKDPYFILPVLLGASMVAQQLMTPATGDPAQRKMMMWMMPAMMIFFFASTPSGLCLYYMIFNIIGMGQAWWLKRTYKPQPVVI
ncbi:MAG TPA: membrane protein insertase YidC [Holophaga sp.]|nr:membrane protein insertase YidC [Holophaga sp.]HPS68047.1 membrane protein insertase YidC [Holophaga sp.]